MYDKKVWKNYDFTYEVILLGECVIENDFEKKKLENVDWIGTQHLFLICSDPDNSIYSKHFSRDCIIYVEKLIW